MIDEAKSKVREHHFSIKNGVDDLREFAYEAENQMGQRACWYRGQTVASWPLQPRIYRPGEPTEFEGALASLFKAAAPVRYERCPSTTEAGSRFHWLSLMRHYGLPTRLLDWTTSILIAAYFAVNDESESTSAIWALAPFHLSFAETGSLTVVTAEAEQLDPLTESALKGDQKDPSVAPVIPTAIDTRMLLQQSRFTIHGSCASLDQHLNAGEFLMKLTIPNQDRKELRVILRMFGIKPSSLFPELDVLSKDIVEDVKTSYAS